MQVKKFASFAVLPEPYHQLFENAGGEWYDYSLGWFQNYERAALNANETVRIYGVESDHTNVPVIALATRYAHKRDGFFSMRGLSSLANFYTISFRPAGDASTDAFRDGLRTLAHVFSSESPRLDFVHLRPLDPEALFYPVLLHSLREAGLVAQTYSCFGNWYLPAEGLTFDEYFRTLSSPMQNTIRRKSKKLEKTGRARIEIVTDKTRLEGALEAYQTVYLSSWKRPEPYPDFISGLARMLAAKGWLRMGVVYLEGQPIASQLWIVNSGQATIYKLAHDQKFDEFSAGSVLTSHLMQHVLDVDKVREIDFGSGDDAYKKNWLPRVRERVGILAMNPRSLRGCFGILRHVGGQATKVATKHLRLQFGRSMKTP